MEKQTYVKSNIYPGKNASYRQKIMVHRNNAKNDYWNPKA